MERDYIRLGKEPPPMKLVRWMELQIRLLQYATEQYNETKDERWGRAAFGAYQALEGAGR